MVYDYYKEKTKKKSGKLITIGVIIFIILVLASIGFGILTEYLEIKEIGQQFVDVFWINFFVKLSAMVVSFLISFVLFYIATIFIRKNILKLNSEIYLIKKKYPSFLVSIGLALFTSSVIREVIASKFLLYANSVQFNINDPIFSQDIGYYIFERPFLMSLIQSISGMWLFLIIFTVIAYLSLYSIATQGVLMLNMVTKEKGIVLHNVINIVIFLAIKALTYKFVSEQVLYSSIGEVVGAGFTDIYVWLKYYTFAPYLLIAISITAIILLYRGKIKYSVYTILVFPAVWILVLLSSSVVQYFIVQPNVVEKEKPFIKNNIEYTRYAYNLNNITERQYPVEDNITAEYINNNSQAFENIRITDYDATLTVLNQLQGIRNFYKFEDTDITAYNIDGQKKAVFVGAREMNKANLPDDSKTFINLKLRYTHGFGVVMNPVNEVTPEGQPEFIIRDIPTTSVKGPEITQPRVYFGELTDDYVIVNTKLKELDYLEGQEDVEFSYDGKSGIKMNLLNKLIFSIKNGDLRMFISGYITPESKLLINRNILDRVEKVAPFFTYDNDPYIVITDDGRLVWVVDIYTTSTNYPYSQKVGSGVNYVRNSGKVIVDAYNGTLDFYITDESDPVIMTYNSIYPSLFNEGKLPEDIQSHVKYPEQLFTIQADILKKYHMTNPTSFYNNSDYWNITKEKYKGEIQLVNPYYNLMNIPETEVGQELILMIPYTLQNKDNMVAWLAVRSNGESYGEMILYKFPKGINVYGPMQIENRIDNNPNISKEMTLWDQGGSSVIRGNLLVIPINNSIIYVEPVYITSENEASLPEMKRVVVAYKDKIVMEPTLPESLIKIFGDEISDVEDEFDEDTPIDDLNLLDEAIATYNELKEASQINDWEEFGRKLQELDEIMTRLEEQNNQIQ